MTKQLADTAASPVVSVLVPSYNAERYVEACLESIVSQTYENLEIIVVDDCSTDRSYEILSEYARRDPRLTLIRNPTNLGNLGNFQRCLEHAGGQYIKFVCCDDFLHGNAIQRMVEVMVQRPDVTLVGSQRYAVDERGWPLEEMTRTLQSLTPFGAEPAVYAVGGYDAGNSVLMRLKNWIGEPTTVMFRSESLPREDLWALGPSRPARNLDIVWWLKIMAGGAIAYINEPLSCFRVREGQISRDAGAQAGLVLSWHDIVIGARALGYLQAPEAEAAALADLVKLIGERLTTVPTGALGRAGQTLIAVQSRLEALVDGSSGAAPAPEPDSVALVDLGPVNAEIRAQVDRSWSGVVDRADFLSGAEVDNFEQAFAGYYELEHCVTVGNGTDALEIALRALGIGAGDEVIVPAFTFAATGLAVLRAGARPVFADVTSDTLLIDPSAVESAITPRTAAVLAVNLFGQPAPLAQLGRICRHHGLALIEDGAQSHGARQAGRLVGEATAMFCTSFYPTKNLGAWGDGGAVLTADPELARQARLLRNYGSVEKYDHRGFGFNSRLDSVQASVLLAKLPHLDSWNAARREVAATYSNLLAGLDGLRLPVTAAENLHVWHLYTVRMPLRDEVISALRRQRIQAGVHYPHALPELPVFDAVAPSADEFPVAQEAAATVLSLPLFVGISQAAVRRVAAAISALRPSGVA
jgi:dTDP-4-amino-4,6-dideoxygalactose transaminase